ncbi:MAG TPA: hypothetical protein VHJ77_02680, partial [Vicinamibacterales bacterium]|nr:hypothetical protein [Vicinamibacterales bacterium]
MPGLRANELEHGARKCLGRARLFKQAVASNFLSALFMRTPTIPAQTDDRHQPGRLVPAHLTNQ